VKKDLIHYGMNQKQAHKAARKRGAVVTPVRRTGEIDVIFPSGRRVRTSARRKDSTRAYIKALRDETR